MRHPPHRQMIRLRCRRDFRALGRHRECAEEPRSWTEHLVWHHAAHAVYWFVYQAGGAIREGREPNASVAKVLPCYKVLHQLEQQLQR